MNAFKQMFNFQKEAVGRRRLTRFKVGHEDNSLCWERHGRDGFLRYSSSTRYFLVFPNIFPTSAFVVPSPVDAHNHFRPFFGPPVPWDMYMNWLKSHGILFSTMLGIGQ